MKRKTVIGILGNRAAEGGRGGSKFVFLTNYSIDIKTFKIFLTKMFQIL